MAEQFHGKEEVIGSTPFVSSIPIILHIFILPFELTNLSIFILTVI